MIIDSSVIVAILRNEPEAARYLRVVEKAAIRRISAANFLESAIIVDANRNAVLSRELDELLQEAAIVIESVTEVHARVAREAYRDFGKGSRHRAQLNFGDCFAYALAKVTREPLLFKGNDFRHTDVVPALGAGN